MTASAGFLGAAEMSGVEGDGADEDVVGGVGEIDGVI